MLTVGDRFPDIRLAAVVGTDPGQEFAEIGPADFPGRWLVVFAWPMDFTFICPTEIAEFGRRYPDFRAQNAEVLGFSTDTQFVHLAWRRAVPALRGLPFPMLADPRRRLAGALGIVDPELGVARRATYVVDPDRRIRFVSVTDHTVGRNVGDVLRVLAALQTGELCPCNWEPGAPTLGPEPAGSSPATEREAPAPRPSR